MDLSPERRYDKIFVLGYFVDIIGAMGPHLGLLVVGIKPGLVDSVFV